MNMEKFELWFGVFIYFGFVALALAEWILKKQFSEADVKRRNYTAIMFASLFLFLLFFTNPLFVDMDVFNSITIALCGILFLSFCTMRNANKKI
ncbi:hypothetical protein [Burkholderia cenocepacia]|uniref:hypothetical protein n=1 Tax=Burkholderia cenocepacia TaxID=95486 RepID=UPI001178170F|nr:hypothetical protein [Burkholderia cenocepacia]